MEQQNYNGAYQPDVATTRAESEREKRLEKIRRSYPSSLDFNTALETARTPLARKPYVGVRE